MSGLGELVLVTCMVLVTGSGNFNQTHKLKTKNQFVKAKVFTPGAYAGEGGCT